MKVLNFPLQKSLEKEISAGKTKTAAIVDKGKLQSELQELRTLREKVIEERKQFDLELKGLNVQVLKKVGCFGACKV